MVVAVHSIARLTRVSASGAFAYGVAPLIVEQGVIHGRIGRVERVEHVELAEGVFGIR